jgi:hypothetical protein
MSLAEFESAASRYPVNLNAGRAFYPRCNYRDSIYAFLRMELLGLEPRSRTSKARRIVLYPTAPIPESGIAPLFLDHESIVLLLYYPGCTQSDSNRRYPECKSGAIPLRHECSIRSAGIEPAPRTWKDRMLPLQYDRS